MAAWGSAYTSDAMGINEVVTAIEAMLATYDGGGAKAVAVQVRPSGDDVDVIKIWCDLGGAKVDRHAWEKAAEAAIKRAVPDAASFRLQVHAEL
jgi:hypothetical protein